jgi:hypothetical protein
MKYRFLATAFLVVLLIELTSRPVLAVPVPMADVPAMAQQSDQIVVGRASQTANPLAPFLITVDRVLKGTDTSRRLVVELDPNGHGAVQERQYGIFFLRRPSRVGSYTVTDPFHPALVASPALGPTQTKSGNVLADLARELIGVLTTPAATLTDPVNGVQDPVTATLADGGQDVYYQAARALRTIPYADAGLALSTLAMSGQVPARLWAMYSLFSMVDANDESAKAGFLGAVEPFLVNPPADLTFTVSMLGNAVESHLKSPAAVPTLAALLGSGNVAVRRAAASVLGDIATADVVGPLAKLALNDGDERVRFLAVRGLAQASGAAGPPLTVGAFHEQPDEILQFWKGWARVNVGGP